MQAERDGVSECLFRLKTECEIEGLNERAGFDAWIAWANELLGALDAPVSRPGRLASEDARAEATRLPEQPSPGFCHQSRGQVVPFALASEGKTAATAQAARPATPGDGAAGLAGEVERLRARFGLAATLTDADVVGWALGALVDAEARAEAAERSLTAWQAHPQHGQRMTAGVRLAIAWLHARGHAMNDPHAKAVIDCAADHLGKAMSRDPTHPEDAVIAAALGEALSAAARLRDRATTAEAALDAEQRRAAEKEWIYNDQRDRLAAVERERDEARVENERLVGLLRKAATNSTWCPDCGCAMGHAPDCALAAAIAAPQPSGALGSLKTQAAENQASPSDSPDISDLALVEQGAEHQDEPRASKADPGEPDRVRAQAFKEAGELVLSVQRSTSEGAVDRCLRAIASALHRRALAAGSADGGEHG